MPIAWTACWRCCRDDDETVRRTAVEQLPFFEDARAFEALAQALEDDAAPVRAAAASALGARRASDRERRSLRALDDSDPWVRFVTLRSLGAIGATEARAAGPGDGRKRSCAARSPGGDRGPRTDQSVRALDVLEPLTTITQSTTSRGLPSPRWGTSIATRR